MAAHGTAASAPRAARRRRTRHVRTARMLRRRRGHARSWRGGDCPGFCSSDTWRFIGGGGGQVRVTVLAMRSAASFRWTAVTARTIPWQRLHQCPFMRRMPAVRKAQQQQQQLMCAARTFFMAVPVPAPLPALRSVHRDAATCTPVCTM
ncbi:hypothetical protein JKP88DRAFT_241538 [Tribonema minus]|uniref:Uncharacterized protein n=1 Tax=Tribonema minus TaxID=303371 RepID=A0A836CCF9_9STRA|nr:hypothetical protein JKP88DRAFT_241538 [Tribonema minus]